MGIWNEFTNRPKITETVRGPWDPNLHPRLGDGRFRDKSSGWGTPSGSSESPRGLNSKESSQLYNNLASSDEMSEAGDSEEEAGIVLDQARQVLGRDRITPDVEARFFEHMAALNAEGWDAGGSRDQDELASAYVDELNKILSG